jgi:hypothetical protein
VAAGARGQYVREDVIIVAGVAPRRERAGKSTPAAHEAASAR